MRFLVINGPNLNLLGIREPEVYGKKSYNDLVRFIEDAAEGMGAEVRCYQSNHEGDIVDAIQNVLDDPFDGLVINPGGYTHTSVAIPDAIKAVSIPAVEVHISDVEARESYRRISYVRDACIGTVAGRGFEGYREAMRMLKERLEKAKKDR